jgi:CRISPR-associated protein Cmr6
MSYPLPADIRALDVQQGNIENFGLLFHRFVREGMSKGGKAEYQEYTTLIDLFGRPTLQHQLKPAIQAIQQRQDTLRSSLTASGYWCSDTLTLEVVWRLTSGLGTPSVFNVGFTLHHVFGFPYLPGSTLKGIVRHYAMMTQIAEPLGIQPVDVSMLDDVEAIRQWKEKHPPTAMEWLEALLAALHKSPNAMTVDERKGVQEVLDNLKKELGQSCQTNRRMYTWPTREAFVLKDNYTLQDLWDGIPGTFAGCAKFCQIFGSTQRRGGVLFFDLLSAADPPLKLALDIMNPHYGKYYTDAAPPADYLEPVPVYFLTVDQGSQFSTFVAARDQVLLDQILQRSVNGQWTGWLCEALEHWGAGGKTRAGYGELAPKAAPLIPPTTRSTSTPLSKPADATLPEIQAVRKIPPNRVSQELYQYYQKLNAFTDAEQRRQLAQAMVEKLAEADWKAARTKEWVKEVQRIARGSMS